MSRLVSLRAGPRRDAPVSLSREAARRTPRAGGSTGMLALRPPDLRPRQAFGAVGASGGRRAAGIDLPVVSGGTGFGRRARPVRLVRRHATVDPTRSCGLSGVRTHRGSGRLAQLEERRPYKAKVGGSSPSAPTDLPAGAVHAA